MKLLLTRHYLLLVALIIGLTQVSGDLFHKKEQSVLSYDTINGILDKVQIANQQVYDSAGKLKADIFKSWSDSELKSWIEAHEIEVPAGADLHAIAEKHKDLLSADIKYYTDKAAANASPILAKGKEQLEQAGQYLFDTAVETWSDSRLKDFLESRNVELSSSVANSRDELIKLAKKNKDKVVDTAKHGKWSFDSWSLDDLTNWLKEQGQEAKGTRDQLVAAASEKLAGAKDYISDVSSTASKSASNSFYKAKKASFNKWSESDLKAYLQSYGITPKPTSKKDELVALAKNQYELFVYGKKQTTFDKVLAHGKSGLFTVFAYAKLGWVKLYSFVYGLIFDVRQKVDL